MIHKQAVVDASAKIADDAQIGPFTVVGSEVSIGAGTWVGSHVVISGPTSIGRDNRLFPFAIVGAECQDKKYAGEPTRLEIGNGNVIREYCSLHRGTVQGGGVTRIGDNNWIMAYVHIAHDCVVGNDSIFANAASLAGHVVVEDNVILGGFTLVHQFCRVGAHSFTGMGSVLNRDVPPYIMVGGPMSAPRGINSEGLKRRGFSSDRIRIIKQAYRIIYKKGLKLDEARQELSDMATDHPDIQLMVDFLSKSQRSILR
ncbi:MAG: acyl-ACP--UDP-N-acetylglucosamine O-acyltransferase [Gammaproteobacteria bacterium]|nr:MAG: acyl-ACP--UDP-N-acetylglucosamine O-acyltransferase [Gammaproteobacteria bacterium]